MPNDDTPNPGLESIISNSIKEATAEPEVETAEAVVDDNAITTDEPEVKVEETKVEEPAIKLEPETKSDETPEVKVEEKKEEKVPDDEVDLDKIPARGTDNRVNRIPHPRVVKITENAVKKATAPLQAELDKGRGTLERIAKVEHIMFEDKPKFIEMLKQIPGYAELLTPVVKPADAEFKMPEPDVKNDKGEPVGYTLTGLQTMVQAVVKQARMEAVKETEEKLGKRLEPFEKREKDAKAEAEFEAAFQKEYDATMTEANKWPLFKENQDAILAALVKDSDEAKTTGRRPKLTLERAYQTIVLPKLTTDRIKMRAELLAELAKKPTSTSVVKKEPAAVAKKEAEDTPSDLTAIIKAAVDASKVGA